MHNSIKLLLPVFLVAVIMSSGCVNIDPQALAMANPMIQEFLDEHPNAEVRVTHYTKEQSKNILNKIWDDCNNEYIKSKDLYLVNITDLETDLYAVVWIDGNTQELECVIKYGSDEVTPEPTPTEYGSLNVQVNSYTTSSGVPQAKLIICEDTHTAPNECNEETVSGIIGSVITTNDYGQGGFLLEYGDYLLNVTKGNSSSLRNIIINSDSQNVEVWLVTG